MRQLEFGATVCPSKIIFLSGILFFELTVVFNHCFPGVPKVSLVSNNIILTRYTYQGHAVAKTFQSTWKPPKREKYSLKENLKDILSIG